MKKEKDYKKTYERMTERIRRTNKGAKRLVLFDRVLTATMYVAYPLMLLVLFIRGMERGIAAAFGRTMKFILVPGISFIVLSLVREKVNRKRPYESWDIDPLIHKNTKGKSMPSRHVFSSAVISMCLLKLSVPLGIAGFIVTLLSCVVRVLGGVHYPLDVAAGLAAGILAGSILWLL